jgi:hypothetical protein
MISLPSGQRVDLLQWSTLAILENNFRLCIGLGSDAVNESNRIRREKNTSDAVSVGERIVKRRTQFSGAHAPAHKK